VNLDPGAADALDGMDLSVLDDLPIAEHAAAYARVHDRLQETLSSLDEL